MKNSRTQASKKLPLKIMEKMLNKLPRTYIVAEYIIFTYAAITAVINLLNIAGVTAFTTWCMKPTFFGVSLLLLLLWQYGLITANRENSFLVKIRPYVMGILAAGIVSTCSLSLCLLLALVVGYFLLSGFQEQYTAKEALLMLLVNSVCMEIYCMVMLLQGDVPDRTVGRFLGSVGLDVFFVLAAALYGIAVREPEEERKEERKKEVRHFLKFRSRWMWLRDNNRKIVRFVGGVVCVFSLGIFAFFVVTIAVGANKLAGSQEETYLLENRENPSLVLTVTEGKTEGSYELAFQDYEGTNNQKVRLRGNGEGIYQLMFLEPECALTTYWSADFTKLSLKAEPLADSTNQSWRREVISEKHNWYNWFPLAYDVLPEGEGLPAATLDVSNGDYEIFTLKRTIEDGFVTQLLEQYQDEFTPTLLMETMITFFGPFIGVIILLITLTLVIVIYLRRLIGDKLAVLYAIIFAYLVAYGAISAIMLYFLIFGWQCYYGYCSRREI